MLSRGRFKPWIENLIVSFGNDEGKSMGSLKAHVIGVGDMSHSQALGSDGPTGLLFLSDEQVQIPAVLTATAWENLQDREDRECFNSLLNTTVGIQDYKLQFHVSSEQTQSRFYLLVGKLFTMAVGVRDHTPCCTSLPSVRSKICHTWRAIVLTEEDSQNSESVLNLTELLGEWQQDCLQTELEHVRKKLCSVNPQSSTSSINPTDLPDTCTETGWDIDGVRYKGIKTFTVPVQLLLIPDTGGQQNLQSEDVSENVRYTPSNASPESTNVEVAVPETGPHNNQHDRSSPIGFAPVVPSSSEMSPMANPWDMCPPPSITSSTNSSPETRPVLHSPIVTDSTTILFPSDNSTHVSANSREFTAEPSFFPPYQRPLGSTNISSTASSRQPADAPFQVIDPICSTTQETSDGKPSTKCKKSLQKRSMDEDVSLILDEGEQVNSSPPSWLFDSQMGATSEQNTSQTQSPTFQQLTKVYPCVHTDGKPFSYTYQVKGQELQRFSCFRVEQDLQQWAVRYLLRPPHTQHNSTGATAHSHIALS